MSFRLFVYYCAICGAWAAFVGWIAGTLFGANRVNIAELTAWERMQRTGILGMFLGLVIAFGLSLLDATWIFGVRRIVPIILRVGVALLVGALGGLLGGMFGQLINDVLTRYLFVVAWVIAGTLIGLSIAAYELLESAILQKDLRSSMSKLMKCTVGGAIGGGLGGTLALLINEFFRWKWPHIPISWFWTPTGVGFVVVGACIGLLVGLAQIILKEAWVKVEAGFRAGREMILAKEITTAGRAESCDIGLFGDPGVEKLHLRIIMKGNDYYLEDCNTPGGTFINDVKVNGQAPLHSGDLIRLGRSLLRFFEKPKKGVQAA